MHNNHQILLKDKYYMVVELFIFKY